MLPCVLFIGIFMYYPLVNGVYHSFFHWNGGDVDRYVGVKNYQQIFTAEPKFWEAFRNALIIGCANIIKMLPAIITAVCLHRVRSDRLQFIYRIGFVIPMVIPQLVSVLLWKAFFDPTAGVLNRILHESGLMAVLNWLSQLATGISKYASFGGFFDWAGALFRPGQDPQWLGQPKYFMLALIIYGFPWVASFGVLCYLAVLQTIGKEIYEAADVDGAGWFTKFRHIEMPLITRQVRIMMVLVIMESIKDVYLVMLLFNINGGAEGAVQMPALFMFREAFMSQQMGYACGIGVVLFGIILAMTKLNEWLIKPAD